MSHCDETTLALAALGEDIPADEAAHLHSCTQCTADVAELIEVVALGREAPAELPEVPDHIWAGIRRELALTGAPDGSDAASSTAGTPPVPGDPGTFPPAVVPIDGGAPVARCGALPRSLQRRARSLAARWCGPQSIGAVAKGRASSSSPRPCLRRCPTRPFPPLARRPSWTASTAKWSGSMPGPTGRRRFLRGLAAGRGADQAGRPRRAARGFGRYIHHPARHVDCRLPRRGHLPGGLRR